LRWPLIHDTIFFPARFNAKGPCRFATLFGRGLITILLETNRPTASTRAFSEKLPGRARLCNTPFARPSRRPTEHGGPFSSRVFSQLFSRDAWAWPAGIFTKKTKKPDVSGLFDRPENSNQPEGHRHHPARQAHGGAPITRGERLGNGADDWHILFSRLICETCWTQSGPRKSPRTNGRRSTYSCRSRTW